MSATNRFPQDAISEGRLREDLYYRLNVISIRLPALSEREKDPSQIANHFLKKFSELENKVFVGFEKEALKLIDSFDWPGNVRQLENTIHSSVIMSEGPLLSAANIANQLHLTQEQLTRLISNSVARTLPIPEIPSSDSAVSNGAIPENDHIQPLAQVERATIEHAIALCEENVVKAASMLEVSPSTLYRKIQQWQE